MALFGGPHPKLRNPEKNSSERWVYMYVYVKLKVLTFERQCKGDSALSMLKKVDEEHQGKRANNTNNNNRDDIYGAVIMAQPLREFTQFIWWMQTKRRGGRQPSDQANRLGLWVHQKEMAATVRIHHRHLLLLSPRSDTHFTIPRRVEGWVDLGTAVRVCSPWPRLHIAVAVVINTTARSEIRTWVLSHRSQACYH